MKNRLQLLLLSLILLAAGGLAACSSNDAIEHPKQNIDATHNATEYIDTAQFLSSELFAKSLAEFDNTFNIDFKPQIAVMPHHDVAAALTAQCMAQLPAETKTVILLGPNHQNSGKQIMTTAASFRSVAGTVENASEITAALVQQGVAGYAQEQFDSEHSIGMLIPYIAQFMPEARIVPIICHHSLTLEQGQKLLDALSPYIDENTVLIGSIDFSHGLTADAATEHNRQMLTYIYNQLPSIIAKLDSTYVDAPGLLAALVDYAAELNCSQPLILADTNAESLLQSKQIEVTSYLTILY